MSNPRLHGSDKPPRYPADAPVSEDWQRCAKQHAAGSEHWHPYRWADPPASEYGDSTPTRHRSDTLGPCLACKHRAESDARVERLLDPETVASAMNDAYEYEPEYVPVLPFFDDVEAFWDPFAKKVAANLRAALAKTEDAHA